MIGWVSAHTGNVKLTEGNSLDMPGVRDTGELKSLTSLRGLAAMAVVLQHFSATAQDYCRVTIPSLVPHGYVAVDFFFVLSGFIMAYTYAASFRQRGLRAYGPFLVKRVARIVPLNVAALIIIALAGEASALALGRNVFFQSTNLGYDFTANLLMVQEIGIGTNLNGPSWSISVEFAAYFLFPVFNAAVLGPRRLAWAGVVLATAGICGIGFMHPHLGVGVEGPPGSLVRCFTEFTLGMAAYRLFQSRWAASVLGHDAVTAGLSVAAAAALVARYDLPAVLLFPFIVVAYAVNNGLAARIMQMRLFYFLGIISFSLYLLHNPFRPLELGLLQAIVPQPVGPVAALAFAFAGAVSVIPFAWLAYLTVERPGRRFVRLLFTRAATSPLQPELDVRP